MGTGTGNVIVNVVMRESERGRMKVNACSDDRQRRVLEHGRDGRASMSCERLLIRRTRPAKLLKPLQRDTIALAQSRSRYVELESGAKSSLCLGLEDFQAYTV